MNKFYSKLDLSGLNFPLIIEENIISIQKTKKVNEALAKILGKAKSLLENKGVLIVSKERPKTVHSKIKFRTVDELGLNDLAPNGKLGRLVLYTDQAVAKLGDKK